MDNRIEKIVAWVTTDGTVHRDQTSAEAFQQRVDLRDHFVSLGFSEEEGITLAIAVLKKFKLIKYPTVVQQAG